MTARSLALHVDGILHAEGAHRAGATSPPWLAMTATIVAGGFVYGLVMGSYGLRPLQSFYSGVKVPLLLGVSTLLCLPSFYVVNSILGLRTELAPALHGLLAAQATLALTLASLSPVTLLFYASIDRYPLATTFNGLQFLIATLAGQTVLARHYRPLVRRNPRHRIGKTLWLVVYIFVAIQMAWVLRPFIGAPGLTTRFFRENAWSNAYVRVARAIMEALTGG